MATLIRMDSTGHTTLAEWTAEDTEARSAADAALRSSLENGYYAVLSRGEGHAEQVRELPAEGTVILRRPIAGGSR